MNEQPNFESIRKKVEEMKRSGTVDLSTDEDLSIAVMNLISLEEHFFFTAKKTDQAKYFDLMNEVRGVRKTLLGKLIDKHEGETWCISKHLLAATMRLMEVGTKLYSDKKTKEAEEMFAEAYKLYSLFWALRLKLIDTAGFAGIADGKKPWTLQEIVNKMVNCCDE